MMTVSSSRQRPQAAGRGALPVPRGLAGSARPPGSFPACRKRLTLAIALCCVAAALVGCGGGDGNPPGARAASPDRAPAPSRPPASPRQTSPARPEITARDRNTATPRTRSKRETAGREGQRLLRRALAGLDSGGPARLTTDSSSRKLLALAKLPLSRGIRRKPSRETSNLPPAIEHLLNRK